MLSDLRYAWRALWKSPTTTLGAMLALALGIGSTTTMFGLLNAVALRPLPYPESDRIVELWGNVQREALERRGLSVPDYLDYAAKSRTFSKIAAWENLNFIRYGDGAPELVGAETVAGDYFTILGVNAIEGRTLSATDDAIGAPLVAVISERLWERAYGRSADVIGRPLRLDSFAYTVVGVVPAKFKGRSDDAEVWVSMIAFPPRAKPNRGSRGFSALAVLAPGVDVKSAQADVSTVAKQLEQAYPASNEKRGLEVSPLANEVFGGIRPAIGLLFGAVGFVLVIACASVASLLLARTESRRREFSLRRAIGADERRLARLMLSESAWCRAWRQWRAPAVDVRATRCWRSVPRSRPALRHRRSTGARSASSPARHPDHGGDRIVAAALDGQALARAGLARGRSKRAAAPLAGRSRRSSRSRSPSPSRCSSARRCSAAASRRSRNSIPASSPPASSACASNYRW